MKIKRGGAERHAPRAAKSGLKGIRADLTLFRTLTIIEQQGSVARPPFYAPSARLGAAAYQGPTAPTVPMYKPSEVK